MIEAVTLQDLFFDCSLDYLRIETATLQHGINRHASLHIKLLIQEGDVQNEFVHLDAHTPVILRSKKTKEIFFNGIVVKARILRVQDNKYMEIESLSHSYTADIEEKRRSYQDQKVSCNDIIKHICDQYPGVSYLPMIDLSEPVDRWFLQYKQTDWELLQDILFHKDSFLIIDETADKFRFWAGMPRFEMRQVIDINYSIYREMNQNSRTGRQIQSFNCTFSHIASWRIGDYVRIAERDYYIVEKRGELKQGELIFSYKAQLFDSVSDADFLPFDYTGLSIEGNVLDVKNNLVKVHLSIDEEQKKETALWIPYVPEGSNIFYCMPEVGSNVKVYIPEKDINQVIAVNLVRTTPVSPQESEWMKSPETKLLSNADRKLIALKPNQIQVESIEGKLYFTIDDTGMVRLTSNTDIDMQAQGQMRFTGTKVLHVSADKSIILQSQDASSIYLETDVQLNSDDVKIFGADQNAVSKINVDTLVKKSEGSNKKSEVIKNQVDAVGIASVAVSMIPAQADGECSHNSESLVTSAVPFVSDAVAGSGYSYESALQQEGEIKQEHAASGFSLVKNQAEPVIDPISALEAKNVQLTNNLNEFYSKDILQRTKSWESSGYQEHSFRSQTWTHNTYNRQLKFDPVDVVTGELIYEKTDFILAGRIPLKWKWKWVSHSLENSTMGYGIIPGYDWKLCRIVDKSQIVVIIDGGRGIIFPDLLEKQQRFHESEGFILSKDGEEYRLHDLRTDHIYVFENIACSGFFYNLTHIKNKSDISIDFFYKKDNYLLDTIVDTRNQKIELQYNNENKIIEISRSKDRSREILVSYSYDTEGNLMTVEDRVGSKTKFLYNDHLLIQRTDKDGNSFYWEYDTTKEKPVVVHTWGDFGALKGRLAYQKGLTTVTQSSGKKTKYHYDASGRITEVITGKSRREKYNYNEVGQLISFVNAFGRETCYEYDTAGMLCKIKYPDTLCKEYQFDEFGNIVEFKDIFEGRVRYLYNDRQQLIKIASAEDDIDLSYDQNGYVSELTTGDGSSYSFTFDTEGNLVEMKFNDEIHKWSYDSFGCCICYVSPDKKRVEFGYDKLRRIISSRTYQASQRIAYEYKYDAQSNLTGICSGVKEIVFDYDILRNITCIHYQGERKEFQYLSDGQIPAHVKQFKDITPQRAESQLTELLQIIKSRARCDAFSDILYASEVVPDILSGEMKLEDVPYLALKPDETRIST